MEVRNQISEFFYEVLENNEEFPDVVCVFSSCPLRKDHAKNTSLLVYLNQPASASLGYYNVLQAVHLSVMALSSSEI